MSRANRKILWTIAVAFLFFGGRAISQNNLESAQVRIALEKSVITQHEPVILDITIQSPLWTSVTFDPGYNWENIEITVVDPDGRRWPRPSGGSREGMKFSRAVHVDTGSAGTVFVVASDWFNFATTGQYAIEVMVKEPHQPVSSTLALSVEKKNEATLKSACAELVERANTAQSFSDALAAATALSDVKDSTAIPYMLATMKHKEFVPLMIGALVRFNSKESQNALEEATKSDDPETRTEASNALLALRNGKRE